MKWRSVDEKPKMSGNYFVYLKQNEEISEIDPEFRIEYFNLKKGRWNCACEENKTASIDMVAWLDPEVPEEFLRPKLTPVKCCPWCLMNNWRIERFGTGGMYYYLCEQKGCMVSGPERETYSEAEAAIFERVTKL